MGAVYFGKPDKRFLASQINDHESWFLAQQFGFTLFQGQFIEKPQLAETADLAPSTLALLNLCLLTQSPESSIEDISGAVGKDVNILYKVINGANILAKTKSKPISDIKQAVVYMGLDALRRLVSLLAMTNLNHESALHIQTLSIQRAIFLSTLPFVHRSYNASEAYIVGAFSLLDVLLSTQMSKAINELNLSQEVRSALIDRKGVYGELLSLCQSLEQANFDDVSARCSRLKIQEKNLLICHQDAREAAGELTKALRV